MTVHWALETEEGLHYLFRGSSAVKGKVDSTLRDPRSTLRWWNSLGTRFRSETHEEHPGSLAMVSVAPACPMTRCFWSMPGAARLPVVKYCGLSSGGSRTHAVRVPVHGLHGG